MEKYLASIFVKDILDLYNLNPTASEYEELGFNIKRDVFYYIINGDTKYINDTKAEALKKLILKKTNNENKNRLFSYLKSHIENVDKIIDKNGDKNSLEKLINYAIDQFKFKDDKEIKEININKIAEYYLKSLNFLNKDLDIAFLIIEEMIEEILNNILIKENLKFINHNGNIIKVLNTLNYKKIIPVYIRSIILFIIDTIPNCNCISSKEIIYSNLKHILKWFYEDYLNISFDKLEEKAENQFLRRDQLLKTYSLKELIKKGWTIELFSQTILELFKNTIDDLAEDNTSSLEEMITIVKKQRESRKIIFKGEKPIGCWSLNPLFQEEFERDCKGEFFVSEFNDILMPTFLKGTYNIHFGVICLEESYRDINTFNKLFFSLIKFIEYMALKGIYIDKICTQTYSEYGKSLAEGIGLKYITKHKDGKGDVYVGDMKTLLKRPFLRDYNLLKSTYKKYNHGS